LRTFIIDENMPRSTAPALRLAGHTANDVRDLGLRGRDDLDVFARAQADDAILITADLGFSSVLRFPPGTHSGIIVLRIPNDVPVSTRIRELTKALAELNGQDLRGVLVIVEVGRTRVRRPPRPDVLEATESE
jgi:predicted nuclease of predicted toxin-antitoxin system